MVGTEQLAKNVRKHSLWLFGASIICVVVGILLVSYTFLEPVSNELHNPSPPPPPPPSYDPDAKFRMEFGSRYYTSLPVRGAEGQAEEIAYSVKHQTALVVNEFENMLEFIDYRNWKNPVKTRLIRFSTLFPNMGNVMAVDTNDDLIAVTINGKLDTDAGLLAFFTFDNNQLLQSLQVGPEPTSVSFSPNGKRVVVPCEGEPSRDGLINPDGSVWVLNVDFTETGIQFGRFTPVTFESFNEGSGNRRLPSDIRVARVDEHGYRVTVAQDLEPHDVSIDEKSKLAFVNAQENNAVFTIDLDTHQIVNAFSAGVIDRGVVGFDASDEDDQIRIRKWENVYSFRQPDGIKYFQGLLFTADEGNYRKLTRLSEFDPSDLDTTAFGPERMVQKHTNLGRLAVSAWDGRNGKINSGVSGTGQFTKLYSFGGRTISILNATTGAVLGDTGEIFERVTAERHPEYFNCNQYIPPMFDASSDTKGPEPEDVDVGLVDGHVFAFAVLERSGGVVMVDATNPTQPKLMDYVNNRNFEALTPAGAGDLGPESCIFIPKHDSPSGFPALIVANTESGTTTLYNIIRQN
mmetsp:Transcript_9701/g.27226  ORF Transcript_9701/g.27226 Transcript_9701/m.27226 type:complete len:575 (-) Transcript_9701:115-1839(-)|eukprot:CAMPEP_0119124106 /NCGR_PEP_ID=MMETSP1310-20130426/3815_1 /TAXON_ID=464262 /ORGANISM="Genus nov. species nov., Strain RCC2339" /LENGTH=574 /DNA_ID=CAMNT_0007113999 /DNA_START=150 /DNA_END=1874 /DNA_ORIENTATION=+